MKKANGEENKVHDFRITLNNNLSRGKPGMCVMFGCPGLSKLGFDFEVSKVEVWSLTPMVDVELATKLQHVKKFYLKE